jgi:diacylglycerol kinase
MVKVGDIVCSAHQTATGLQGFADECGMMSGVNRSRDLHRVHRRASVLSIRIVRSFYHAFAGLWFLLRTQRNARIELLIGAAACGVAAWAEISCTEWAVLVFTIALVLILEGLNTAVELCVDLAMPRRHPLARHAKDLAAGMVLVASIASVAIGLLILGPPVWGKLAG